MPELPKRVTELEDFHRAWNKLIDFVRSITPRSSDDVLVTATSNGASFKLVKKQVNGTSANPIVSIWDENKGYSTGDEVKVDCHHTYSIPFEVASGSAT